MGKRTCAYCGGVATTVDHVIPSCLYPPSKATSKVQRITVPACIPCNQSWVDDEPHFRSVLLMAGDATPVVRELWEGKTRRSFQQPDGERRLRDLAELLKPEGERHKIFPAADPRFMRVLRKVIRGLSHHHQLLTPVPDEQVWADVQRYHVPDSLLEEMTRAHAEPDILEYRFSQPKWKGMNSTWHFRFFERTPFYAAIFDSKKAMDAALAGADQTS